MPTPAPIDPASPSQQPAQAAPDAPRALWAIALLVIAEVAGLTLWFSTAALIPAFEAEFQMSAAQSAALSSAVQAGFVVGALVSAITGLADRIDPRRLFFIAALLAAGFNLALLWAGPDGLVGIVLRGLTGAALAGVYPVGIRLAAAWSIKRRGLMVGWLVGALTLGSALPHLIALGGGADWRLTLVLTSAIAAFGGLLVLLPPVGPFLAAGARFAFADLRLAWSDRRLRATFLGYFGHMLELYAFWAWIAVALRAGFAAQQADFGFGLEPGGLAARVAFAAIAVGAAGCVVGGLIADRMGKAQLATRAMWASGTLALATGLSLGGPWWVTAVLAVLWGLVVIPDSPQFSALVADLAPARAVGSLLTLQTALGFFLTIFTVQLMPLLADSLGWSAALMLLAIGPALGVLVMRPLLGRPAV